MDFEKIIYEKFKTLYNCDLTKEKNISIKEMIFPNYCIQNITNLEGEKEYRPFEYCRIINKLFGFNYLETDCSLYESNVLKIEQNDIVFDCGANTGIFSLYASYKCKAVYAFEPSTLIRHYLRNTKNYNINKIIIIPKGVYNKNTMLEFEQTDNPGAARIIDYKVPEEHEIIYKEKVNLITIDSLISCGIIPNFIKMDIENGEIAALEGAINTLKNYNPKCAISLHELSVEYVDYIKSLFPKNYSFIIRDVKYYDPILLCIPEVK